jgi:hypothetical protein
MFIAALIAGAGFAGLAAPSFAQAAAGSDKMNMVIVYGDDTCPVSKEGEITVCARKSESERYRIPAPFRGSASPQDRAWTDRVLSYETVGASGTQSCSATGPGGWTGCANKFIQNAYAEKKEQTDVHFSEMIAKEREKRAAAVDADAAATQARVEQAEKDYDARKQPQTDAAAKPAAPDAAAPGTKAPAPAEKPVAQPKPGKRVKKNLRKSLAAPPAG